MSTRSCARSQERAGPWRLQGRERPPTPSISADRELTLEANPETVTSDRLAAFRAAGVNRISFGVQSFRDDELRRLSRLHGAARAREAYADARAAGFDNV